MLQYYATDQEVVLFIVPSASEFPGLIPHLLQQRVVLDDDCVLDEASLRRGRRVAVGGGGAHAERAEGDVECGLRAA